MSLPDVLQKAGTELRDATAAWRLVDAAALMDADETLLLQYVGEAEYAIKRVASLLDEWLTVGQCYMAGRYVPDDSEGCW